MKNILKTAAAAAFAFTVFSCSAEQNPTDVVKSFFDAVAHKNFDQAAKYTTPASAASIEDIKKAMEMQNKSVEESVANLKKLHYSEPQMKGDSAFVDITTEKFVKPMIYTVVKQNGEWKLDLSPSSMKRMVSKQ